MVLVRIVLKISTKSIIINFKGNVFFLSGQITLVLRESVLYHKFNYHAGISYSLNASLRDVFLSVDSFLVPIISAHGTLKSPAGNFFR